MNNQGKKNIKGNCNNLNRNRGNVVKKIIEHPLVQRDVTQLRNKNTNSEDFRRLAKRASIIAGVEVLSGLEICREDVVTPLGPFPGIKISKPFPYFVSIMRAGSIMTDALHNLYPEASIGHIGLSRNHDTLEPSQYYLNLADDLSELMVVICDPMLATAGSAIHSINLLKQKHASNIIFFSLLASKYGVERLSEAHPDIKIFTCAMDEELNDHGYILPGLGDAGDRLFNT